MKLDSFVEIAGELQKLFHEDVVIAVSDKQEILAVYPGKTFNHPVKSGDLLPESSTGQEAINSG
ncbi:MAG TPA: hypothetical protein VN456_03050 [Desulfosporosinus sp.]|nr:hypothetical protein [Desulfosporosinus sp.]